METYIPPTETEIREYQAKLLAEQESEAKENLKRIEELEKELANNHEEGSANT